MAAIDHTSASVLKSGSLLSRIGTALRSAMDSFIEARTRKAEFEHFNAMSDRELEKLGLRRDQIAQHVFRDLYL